MIRVSVIFYFGLEFSPQHLNQITIKCSETMVVLCLECRPYTVGSNTLICEWIFFLLKLKRLTLWQHLLIRYYVSQSILNQCTACMIVWADWDSSICQNFGLAGHLVFWKSWPVTCHIATAFNIFQVNFLLCPHCKRNHTSSIRATSPKFMCHIYL